MTPTSILSFDAGCLSQSGCSELDLLLLADLPLCAQVPPEQQESFASARSSLPEFTFKELGAEVRNVFDRFIQ
jgi:hypothetical protein